MSSLPVENDIVRNLATQFEEVRTNAAVQALEDSSDESSDEERPMGPMERVSYPITRNGIQFTTSRRPLPVPVLNLAATNRMIMREGSSKMEHFVNDADKRAFESSAPGLTRCFTLYSVPRESEGPFEAREEITTAIEILMDSKDNFLVRKIKVASAKWKRL